MTRSKRHRIRAWEPPNTPFLKPIEPQCYYLEEIILTFAPTVIPDRTKTEEFYEIKNTAHVHFFETRSHYYIQ